MPASTTTDRCRAAAIAAVAISVVVTACATSQPARQPAPEPLPQPTRPAATSRQELQRAPDQPYFEFQVEQPVRAVAGSPQPRYPAELRAASVEGDVVAQYVVDTMGRAEPRTFKVLRSSHELFTASVRTVLDSMAFTPARVGGRKVRQLVQQPFHFRLPARDTIR